MHGQKGHETLLSNSVSGTTQLNLPEQVGGLGERGLLRIPTKLDEDTLRSKTSLSV